MGKSDVLKIYRPYMFTEAKSAKYVKICKGRTLRITLKCSSECGKHFPLVVVNRGLCGKMS